MSVDIKIEDMDRIFVERFYLPDVFEDYSWYGKSMFSNSTSSHHHSIQNSSWFIFENFWEKSMIPFVALSLIRKSIFSICQRGNCSLQLRSIKQSSHRSEIYSDSCLNHLQILSFRPPSEVRFRNGLKTINSVQTGKT